MTSAGHIHHINIKVSDLNTSRVFWGWFLGMLGYVESDAWAKGVSWKLGGTYLDIVQVNPELRDRVYQRDCVGMNHLAFHAKSRTQVDHITAELKKRGATILYEDEHPYAGGPDHYALYFEDPDKIKIELVAPINLNKTHDPYQFAVAKTAQFIQESLPTSNGIRMLEVGAGRGRLTAHLRSMGMFVDAIDKSSDAVKAAEELGVEVQHADISDFKSPKPYDCVLFCMSAHHVAPLEKALDRVFELLRPGGILILEEYAVEDADEPTAIWFEQTRTMAFSLGLVPAQEGNDPFVNLKDPLAWWQDAHSSHGDHHFNSGAELLAGLKARFEILQVTRGPYFYRYLAPRFMEKLHDSDLAQRLYRLEEEMIAAKRIQPLGLRVVARKN